MASFAIKSLYHGQLSGSQLTSTNSTNLITCAASHVYLLKRGSAYVVLTTSDDLAGAFELSDTGGANFKRVSDEFTTPATADGYVINLCLDNPAVSIPSALAVEPTVTQKLTLKNLAMEAGQILRWTTIASSAGTPTMDISISGIDVTL